MIIRAALMLLAAASLLAGCQDGGRVTVDKSNRFGPKYPYELHEFALLKLKANHIHELETEKRYAEIYDEQASEALQARIPRKRFLMMSNCVETFLGEITEYERLNYSFNRKQQGGRDLDVVTRRVQRSRDPIRERLMFVWQGTDFKLDGLHWITTNPAFKSCIEELDDPEADTGEPAAEPEAEPAAPPEEPPADPAQGETSQGEVGDD